MNNLEKEFHYSMLKGGMDVKKHWNRLVYFYRTQVSGKSCKGFFLFTIVFAGLSVLDVILDLFIYPIRMALYVLAAISFFLSCAVWYDRISVLIKAVIVPFIEANALANRFTKDYGFSTIIMTLPGTMINVVFAIVNAYIGVYMGSAWAGSLAMYYMCLSVMRIIVIWYAKHLVFQGKYAAIGKKKELKLQKICGIILIILSGALAGAVFILLSGKGGKHYSEILTIAIAAYTFYKLAMAIKNMIKARKEKDSLIIILRNIGYTDAMVSLLYLQTALFSAFGGGEKITKIMNSVTGGFVIAGSIAIGVAMVIRANKNMKNQIRNF